MNRLDSTVQFVLVAEKKPKYITLKGCRESTIIPDAHLRGEAPLLMLKFFDIMDFVRGFYTYRNIMCIKFKDTATWGATEQVACFVRLKYIDFQTNAVIFEFGERDIITFHDAIPKRGTIFWCRHF